jgi:hypothetical protein
VRPAAKKATAPKDAVEFREETPTVTISRGSNIIVAPPPFKIKCYFFYNIFRRCNIGAPRVQRSGPPITGRRFAAVDGATGSGIEAMRKIPRDLTGVGR